MALTKWEIYRLLKKEYVKTCQCCGKEFVPSHWLTKYCTDYCRERYQKATDRDRESQLKRAIWNHYSAKAAHGYDERLEYSVAPPETDINDFTRYDELGIDTDIQDILALIERDGILEGRVPYMGAPQNEEAALLSMLERFIDERSDPEEVEFFKLHPQARQAIAKDFVPKPPKPRQRRSPRSHRYASDEIAKLRAKFKTKYK